MPVTVVSKDKASQTFAALRSRYQTRHRAIPVSFRALSSEIGVGDRFTHFVHPYPAKLLRSIPAFFLSVRELAPVGTVVWDPFCGSGTVLVEAMCAGFESVGLDVNPLATLISRVKTRHLNMDKIKHKHRELLAASRRRGRAAPAVINLEHWFYPHVVRQLSEIEAAIQRLPNDQYQDFFLVCFSVCVRRVSLANPRVSVPVRLRPEVYPKNHYLRKPLVTRLNQLKHINVWRVFSEIIEENSRRVETLASISHRAECEVLTGDVRTWRTRPSNRPCSLVITSPPYLGAQKYVRATSLSLNWLRLVDPASLRPLERSTIGREHLNLDEYIDFSGIPLRIARRIKRIETTNPLRAQIAAHYVADLRTFFEQVCVWLTPNGRCILIIGPNTLCGQPFNTPAVAFELADRSLADPEAKLSNPKIERLVFVDDFCGSGSQAVRMADAMLPLLRRLADTSGVTIDISYLVLFANTEGIARVRERKQFDSVETVFELDDSYRVFSENARQFTTVPDGISKPTARAIAETYGTVLSTRWPLGFKDGQLLLAFHHNIPNNSLPILWAGQPEQEGWHGIFRRFPKYYGRKHS